MYFITFSNTSVVDFAQVNVSLTEFSLRAAKKLYIFSNWNTEAYPGLPQASTMDSFASIVNGKKSTYEVAMELDFG